jgi:hypothetical protein
MDRFNVKKKHKSIDNENVGEELENKVTVMNEQPPEKDTVDSRTQRSKRWTDKYFFVLHHGTSSLCLIFPF